MSTETPPKSSTIVQKGLNINLQNKQMRNYLKWASLNVLVLTILLMDLSNKCPYAFSHWYYVEYAAAALLMLSIFCYTLKYVYYLLTFDPIKGTSEQKRLLHFDEADSSFIVNPTEKPRETQANTNTPLNSSLISWYSFNDTKRSKPSPVWHNTSPSQQQNMSGLNYSWNRSDLRNSFAANASPNQSLNNSFNSSFKSYAKDEIITDEQGLQKYLKDIAREEINANGSLNYSDARDTIDHNSMNTLWSYCNNAANLLKTSIYQLSPTITTANKPTTGKDFVIGNSVGPGCSSLEGVSEVQKAIPSSKLTEYVTNLRMWISATILQRLVKEFDKIDSEFGLRGFSDIKIGSVGLERLKKTAENQLVAVHVPTLPMVIPFLEMSANQEYLVQRIRGLSRGSGINDYRWNAANTFDSNWDDHVTDAAIIFHLFCAYMDSQLMPLPQPGGRPFYNRYVVFGDKKSAKETIEEVRSKAKYAILCTNPVKPKFNLVSDDKIHHCNHERNNLFCVIIHFLIYIRDRNSGLLDGVNLGRGGLNILGVIED